MKPSHSIPYLLLIGLLACMPASHAQNNDMLKVSRYGFLSLAPKPEQTDVLSVVVEIEFPREIQKVGDALAFLLQNSGYRLEDPEQYGQHQYVLYNFDLPEAHRKIGPVMLWDALSVIGNDGFLPWANPLSRTIRYELDEVKPFEISEAEIACARDRWINRHDPEYVACVDNTQTEKQQDEQASFIYGPVQCGETLSRIAESLRMENVAVEQIMAAIFYANPHGFGDNINMLLAGATLTIPDTESIQAISIEHARDLVHTHHRQWINSQGDKQHD